MACYDVFIARSAGEIVRGTRHGHALRTLVYKLSVGFGIEGSRSTNQKRWLARVQVGVGFGIEGSHSTNQGRPVFVPAVELFMKP